MTIEKEVNGSELIIKAGGRLDTSTAPELDKVLMESYGSMEKLVFDFEGLEYISSAGLRVLLSANKRMGAGNMVVRHINEVVAEVFDVTGFADILTVE